jgi:hypothetical protein
VAELNVEVVNLIFRIAGKGARGANVFSVKNCGSSVFGISVH